MKAYNHQYDFGTNAVYAACYLHKGNHYVSCIWLAIVFQLLTFGLFLILLSG